MLASSFCFGHIEFGALLGLYEFFALFEPKHTTVRCIISAHKGMYSMLVVVVVVMIALAFIQS